MRWNKRITHSHTAHLWTAATWIFFLTLLPAALTLGQNAPVETTPLNQPSAPAQPAAVPRSLLIMIDPAHGGSESGAVLNAAMPEKDVNLAIARRLRQELGARAIQAVLIRDSDATLSTDLRAQIVNSARPALYIAIHSTSQGSGMRIYTAMLPAAADNSGPFVDWQTAQASALSRSRWIQDQVAVAIQKTGFPFHSLMAPLRPLSNVAVPAMAVEIAPTTGDVSQLASADYQQMITGALANSIAAIRTKLESAP
jgi:N-acetylmuramoyl-L-alanine amidase